MSTQTNYGTISTVYLAGNDTIINGGPSSTDALISGARYGIERVSEGLPGTVVNFGTVEVTSHYNAINLSGNSVVTNFGTIAALTKGGYGVRLNNSGFITNGQSGLIEGGYFGIVGAGTVINDGTILGERAGIIVAQYDYGVFTNTGTVLAYGNGLISATGVDAVDTTAVNEGIIYAANAQNAVGIHGGTAATIQNNGTIKAVGTLSGVGILIVNDGSRRGGVTNTGTIAGSSVGLLSYVSTRFTNQGTITGGSIGVSLPGAGTVINAGGVIQGATGVYMAVQPGTVTNSGTIAGTSTFGINLKGGGTVVNSGTISGANGTAIMFGSGDGGADGNLLALEHGYALTGNIALYGIRTTLELLGAAGAVGVTLNSHGFNAFGRILFGTPYGNSETLTVTNTTGVLSNTISGFGNANDIIDLSQIGTDGHITNFDTDGHWLTLQGSGGTITLSFDANPAAPFTTASDNLGGTDLSVACYCRGTMILTEYGEVPVEELLIGDRLVTLSGETKVVRWIGRRGYDGRFLATNRAVLPIRIESGAFADGLPTRDLWVSPEHALYIDGALAPARLLVNGMTIVQADTVKSVEYFHIELDAHDIIFADGMPAETFVDCDNRLMFQNAHEFAALYPLDERATWAFCAPRLEAGSAELVAIRKALFARAEALGHRLDLDPDLHLIVDGTIVWPDALGVRLYRFAIPAGSSAVSLVSRSAAPAEVDCESRDGRRLGVPVERIAISNGDLSIEAWHSHTALCDGFHGDEGTHRWTDGLARLPSTWLGSFPSGATLDVHLIPTVHRYPLPPSSASLQWRKRPHGWREGDVILSGEPCTSPIRIMVEPEMAYCSAA